MSRGISDAEKPHLRRKLLELIREENNQVAVQLALLISKIARFDYPREWQELFPTLLQKLQSPDVLMTQRVYLVLNQILKELSTKRLAADQRNFAEVYILGFICNLANIEHRALSGQGQEEINGIVLVCSLLAGRSLRDLRCS
jgi:glutathionyl-hydroquinone reductase